MWVFWLSSDFGSFQVPIIYLTGWKQEEKIYTDVLENRDISEIKVALTATLISG